MNDLDTEAPDPALAARLERLAERGPHRDADAVIDRIFAEADSPSVAGRRMFAVAAGLAVLAGLGAATWSATRPDSGNVIADEPTTSSNQTTLPELDATTSTTAATATTTDESEESVDGAATSDSVDRPSTGLAAVAEATGLRIVAAEADTVTVTSSDGVVEIPVQHVAQVFDEHIVAGPRVYTLGGELACEAPDGLPGIYGDLRYPLIDAVGVDGAGYWAEYDTFEAASSAYPTGSMARYRLTCATGTAEEVAPTTFHGATGESIETSGVGDRTFTVTFGTDGFVTIENDQGVILTEGDTAGYNYSLDASIVAYEVAGALALKHLSNEIVIRDASTGAELLRRAFGDGEQLVSRLEVVGGWVWVGISGPGWGDGSDSDVEVLHQINPTTGEALLYEVDAPIIWLG